MSATPPQNPQSVRFPFALEDVSEEVRQAHQYAFRAITSARIDLQSLQTQVTSLQSTASSAQSAAEAASTQVTQIATQVTTGTTNTVGGVSNQTGLTTYTLQQSDYGALVIFNDASAIAVTLPALTLPFFAVVSNLGAGAATLTPSSGTINGAANLVLNQNQFALVFYDGTNWDASPLPVVPQNTPAVAGEVLIAYNATTGAFTRSTAGIAATVALAKLTTGGTNGSATYNSLGQLTAYTAPT